MKFAREEMSTAAFSIIMNYASQRRIESKLCRFSIYIKRYASSSASTAETRMIRVSLQLTNFPRRGKLENHSRSSSDRNKVIFFVCVRTCMTLRKVDVCSAPSCNYHAITIPRYTPSHTERCIYYAKSRSWFSWSQGWFHAKRKARRRIDSCLKTASPMSDRDLNYSCNGICDTIGCFSIRDL